MVIANMQNNIPEQITKFARSPEIYRICEKIGEVFSLHIDQIGELDSEIRGVILGKNKPADFTDHITERLGISKDMASKITSEVNKKIFDEMRRNIQTEAEQVRSSSKETVPQDLISSKQNIQVTQNMVPNSPAVKAQPLNPTLEKPQPQTRFVQEETKPPASLQAEPQHPASPLEHVGGFTIDREVPKPSMHATVTESDREKIISHIETPPWKQGATRNQKSDPHTEPLVDYLLSSSSARPQETIVKPTLPARPAQETTLNTPENKPEAVPSAVPPVTVPSKPKIKVVVPPRTGPDPYRESFQ